MREYFEEPWCYEDEILAMGEAAIEPLIAALDQPQGYAVTSLLAAVGPEDTRVREALRQSVLRDGGVGDASALALSAIGDIDFLFQLMQQSQHEQRAVRGIISGLGDGAGSAFSTKPLDYGPLERLLQSPSAPTREVIDEWLKPGSSTMNLKPADVDEALRGLQSEHPVIRQHAVSVLGNRKLGRKLAKAILPALAERLEDDSPTVRRLTLLAMAEWKAAAKPYHEQMLRLKEDRVQDVRITATYVFE